MRPWAPITSTAMPGVPSGRFMARSAPCWISGGGAVPIQVIRGTTMRERGPGVILTTGRPGSSSVTLGSTR